jgi:hypothetical protein
MMKAVSYQHSAVSKLFASLCSPMRDSVDGAEQARAPSHQMEADS